MSEKENLINEEIKEENDVNDTAEEIIVDSDGNLQNEEETMEEHIDSEIKEEAADKKEKSTKSFFKNKKEKKDPKDEKIDELNDRLMRTMAEFDNFRKRSEKEKSQMFEIGAKDIVEKILPVIDNFERGLGTITEEEKEGAFAQGIEKIYKQFVVSLEDAGVKAIEAVGKEFDPNFHNAVMHAEDENEGENIITDEFQKGYMYRESVVRHSMVKVVN